MEYHDLASSIIDLARKNNAWDRVVSVDFETKVLDNSSFLTGERILGIGVARRVGKKIEIKTFLLEEETDESELKLIMQLADHFYQIRPIILLGFAIGIYDHPLIMMKIRKIDEMLKKMKSEGKDVYSKEYWALRDAFVRAHILDSIDPIRFEIANYDNVRPSYLGLDKAVTHKRFSHLPLMKTKDIAVDKANKGKIIYELWKNDKEKFRKYLEGDVHDPLLMMEDIFGIKFD